MAKLSANGTEVARYVRDNGSNDETQVRKSYTWLSVRSNGRVLRKHVAVIRDLFSPKGERRVDYGWKLWQRFPKGVPSIEKLDKLYVTAGGYRKMVAGQEDAA